MSDCSGSTGNNSEGERLFSSRRPDSLSLPREIQGEERVPEEMLLKAPPKARRVRVNESILVVGGGIAGIHAALTAAEAGKKVYLVEREPSIGGYMAKLDKTFPTLDCSACILTPKMSAVKSNPNITLWTYSEVILSLIHI